MHAGDAGVAGLLLVVGVHVLEDGAGQRDRQGRLLRRGAKTGGVYRLGYGVGWNVVVGREVQSIFRRQIVIGVMINARDGNVFIMGSGEVGCKMGSIELRALNDRVGFPTGPGLQFVDVDPHHQQSIRLEIGAVDRHQRAVVVHVDANGSYAHLLHNGGRHASPGSRIAPRFGMKKRVSVGRAVIGVLRDAGVFVGIDDDVGQLRARRRRSN